MEKGKQVPEETFKHRPPLIKGHKPLNAIIILVTFITYLAIVGFNYAASFAPPGNGIFKNSTADISKKYDTEFTPAGWTFGVIWAVIYTWNTVGFLYCLTTLKRKGPYLEYLYVYPPLTPMLMYISLFFNLASNITWIFLWDRQIIHYSVIPSALMAFFLYCALFFTLKATGDHMREFSKYNKSKEIWLVRMLVHNPLAFYATWVTIATLLNLSIALSYRAGIDKEISVTILFCLLSVEVIGWFILDVFIFNQYTRFLFTPYVVVILALIGSLVKNFDKSKRNQIFSAALLGVVGVFAIFKIIRMLIKPRVNKARVSQYEMPQKK